jgi:hypothetical protein
MPGSFSGLAAQTKCRTSLFDGRNRLLNRARFGNGIPFRINCTRINLDFSHAAGVRQEHQTNSE